MSKDKTHIGLPPVWTKWLSYFAVVKFVYMASDEDDKNIYKVNLATGTVIRLFAIPIMTALTLRLLWQGDPLHLLLGFLVFVKEVANLSVGHRYYLNMIESLHARYENEILAARLSRIYCDLCH